VDEQHDDQRPDEPGPAEPTGQQTGEPTVDAVLASLQRLDELPVAEHVAVYESAHAGLREALNRAGGD